MTGSVSSPCNSVCQMDEKSTFCLGCWRTLDEIVAWSSHSEDAKKQVWILIEQRKIANKTSLEIKAKIKS